MAEFCTGCPLRGETNCAIAGIVATVEHGSYETRAIMGKGAVTDSYQGRWGVLLDELNNPSRPLKFPDLPDLEVLDKYQKRLDICDRPETEVRGTFRKHEDIVGCHALGGVAIWNAAVAHAILQHLRPTILTAD